MPDHFNTNNIKSTAKQKKTPQKKQSEAKTKIDKQTMQLNARGEGAKKSKVKQKQKLTNKQCKYLIHK